LILLDTHIWIWWVNGSNELSQDHLDLLLNHESTGLGVSVISCWEVAKLVERKRLVLTTPMDSWLDTALTYPGITLFDLTPKIAVESTQLPPGFHRDPADQMIVATARVFDIPLLTADSLISSYPHVKKPR